MGAELQFGGPVHALTLFAIIGFLIGMFLIAYIRYAQRRTGAGTASGEAQADEFDARRVR